MWFLRAPLLKQPVETLPLGTAEKKQFWISATSIKIFPTLWSDMSPPRTELEGKMALGVIKYAHLPLGNALGGFVFKSAILVAETPVMQIVLLSLSTGGQDVYLAELLRIHYTPWGTPWSSFLCFSSNVSTLDS